MSLRSWKMEFYPHDADTYHGADSNGTDAAQHSLKKWEGLRQCNLHKHGVTFDQTYISDGGEDSMTIIGPSTCALCQKYQVSTDDGTICDNCPLFKARGGVSCCDERRETYQQAYSGDVEPLITDLRSTVHNMLREEMPSAVPVNTIPSIDNILIRIKDGDALTSEQANNLGLEVYRLDRKINELIERMGQS